MNDNECIRLGGCFLICIKSLLIQRIEALPFSDIIFNIIFLNNTCFIMKKWKSFLWMTHCVWCLYTRELMSFKMTANSLVRRINVATDVLVPKLHVISAHNVDQISNALYQFQTKYSLGENVKSGLVVWRLDVWWHELMRWIASYFWIALSILISSRLCRSILVFDNGLNPWAKYSVPTKLIWLIAQISAIPYCVPDSLHL